MKRCMGCMELYGEEFELCPHCGYIDNAGAEEALHMEPGTLLHDRYIVGRVLGFGGFGVTYIGWDGRLEQKVAIKEYLPSEFSTRMPGQSRVTVFNGEKNEQFHDGLSKFVDEAKRLAKFQSEPGIVKVFDSFTENETAYIIMEYLDGETLTERLKRDKTIPEDEAVEMLLPVLESLKTVHEQGILHRDIAPDNIFLLKDGTVKLIDFGASRYATTSHSRSLTVIIKPGFSPEEQYRSRGDQGAYTDVYAMAATMYKMMTGKTPPDAMERRALYENKNKEILEEPHKLNKNISVNREVAILNAMNVRIEDRTPDMATFINELQANPPAKRIYGKIKKIDLYGWPLWLKIVVPAMLALIVTFAALFATGVIKVPSLFSDEVIVPTGIVVVPDVEGMGADEALALIESGNLQASTAGSVKSEYIEAGLIILQTPYGGSYLEENGIIGLTISSGSDVVGAEDGVATVPYVIWDTQEDAVAKLLMAGLADPLVETRYDANVAAGQVISQDPAAFTEVAEGTQITLVVSLGSEAYTLPQLVGMAYEEAAALLKDAGVVVTVNYRQDDSVKAGTVLAQSAEEGTPLSKGETLTLTIASAKDIVNVPDVRGKTREEAIAALEKAGFKVNAVENYDSKVAKNKIIRQNPVGGSGMTEGSTVTIFVSKGVEQVSVPNVVGKKQTVAESTLKDKGFTVEIKKVYDSKTGSGSIISQSPSGGAKADKGSKVTITVSLGTETFAVANVLNKSASSAKTTLEAQGFNVQINETYSSMVAAGNVISQNPVAGTKEPKGATVVITVSKGKQPVTVRLDANGGTCVATAAVVYLNNTYGTLPTPTRDYYNFNGWYTAASGGTKITSATQVSSASSHTLYAQWSLKATSGWVLESQVPSGAQIVNQKWTYSKLESTTSYDTSMPGWVQTDSSWVQTGTGSKEYASFPSGFQKTHSIYTSMAKSQPYSNSETATTKRVVSTSHTGYVFWHWMYDCGSASAYNRAIYNNGGKDSNGNWIYGPANGFAYKYFGAFKSTNGYTYHSNGYCNNLNLPVYWKTGRTSYADSQGTYYWFRFNYYTCTYTDYQKLFTYQKVTNGLETTSGAPSGSGISNVQRYVQYRPK